MKVEIEEILPLVQRPGRYLGNEFNAWCKDWSSITVKIALAFPDTYEIGMSNLGLKILYQVINNRQDALAERVYAPWPDLEKILRQQKTPLFTLESKIPLNEFDIIGFSLQYEMSYTNVLNMLDLAGIPLRTENRQDKKYPLIIAGGPCTFNPEPIASFIDLFVLGEGEDVIEEIIDTYRSHKDLSLVDILRQLAKIEGVYVPSLYEVTYNDDGSIKNITPKYEDVPAQVKKRIVNFEQASYPHKPPVPYLEVVHNRLILEIMRGCTRGCRFCQAGITNRPVRWRSQEKLNELVASTLAYTGYEEVSLSSLSTTDYPQIDTLITKLIEKYASTFVCFTLPSLRPDNFSLHLARYIEKVKKTSLTFAPEAGTARLRRIINKDITEEDLFSTLEAAYKTGWKTVKLYFMIGLPTETWPDIEGIVALAKKIKTNYKNLNLNITISSFIPKPFTPFQWVGQENRESLRQKKEYLYKNLPAQVKWHSVELSYLEAIFSRGDRRLDKVLELAWQKGCRFDQWNEYFRFSLWQEAFAQVSVNPDFYALRQIPLEGILPWNHLSCGVNKQFLLKEYKLALQEETTPDCRIRCTNCGIENCSPPVLTKLNNTKKPIFGKKEVNLTKQKIRIKFAKDAPLQYISHLDLISTWTRALRRAKLPLAYSQGFSPHPKIFFGPPLALGFKSVTEYVDIELTRKEEIDTIVKELSKQLPPGLEILKAREVPLTTKSSASVINKAKYVVRVSGEFIDSTSAVDNLQIAANLQIIDSSGKNYVLGMTLPVGKRNLRPEKVIEEIFAQGYKIIEIKRVGLFINDVLPL